MSYGAFRASLINESKRPDIAAKAAELAEDWWSIRGRSVYASVIGSSEQNRKNRQLRNQFYTPCKEHVMAGFVGFGGFFLMIIIQAIVGWIVKRILDKLIDDLNNNKDSLSEYQMAIKNGELSS